MTKKLFLIIAAASICQSSAQTPTGNAEALYRKGLVAERAGDPSAAREAYTGALAVNPNHANARYRLGQLKLNAGAIASKGREAKMAAVIVPEYKLDEASLQESLDALRLIIEKQSKDEVAPNFVIQDPANRFAAIKISLSLKSMPATAVLKYLTDHAGAKARFDEHAVVIAPK